MFPSVKFIFYPLTHAAAIAVVYLSMRAHLKGGVERYGRYALAVTGLYIFCHGVMSKIFHFAFKADEVPPLTSFLNPVFYFRPGFWGWMMAFLPLAFIFPFVFKLDRQVYYRALALTLPLVIALQKVACFVAGCCAGDRSDLPWAVVFPRGSSAEIRNVPVHPTQIYDILLALSWFAILKTLDKQERFKPYLLPVFLVFYGVSRFSTEMLRPEFRDGFSDSQKLEVIAVTIVVLGLIFGRKLWLKLLGTRPLK
jgi:prolipoprotein diacylglyceryltransferase